MVYMFALLLLLPSSDILSDVTQTLTTIAVDAEEDGKIRQEAINTLSELRLSESNKKLVAEKLCDIGGNANDTDVDTKTLAIDALGRMTEVHAEVDTVAPAVMSRLIAVANKMDANEKVRMMSLRALAELNLAPESKVLLVRALLTLVSNQADGNGDVKSLGLDVLVRLRPSNGIHSEVTKTLTKVAVDAEEDGQVRQKAIRSLTELSLSESNRKLVAENFCDIASNADDNDIEAKLLAINALARLPRIHAEVDSVAPDVLSRLISVASQKNANEKVRMKSLQTLSELNLVPEGKALLVRGLLTLVSNKEDEIIDVRSLGIEMLVRLLESPSGV